MPIGGEVRENCGQVPEEICVYKVVQKIHI